MLYAAIDIHKDAFQAAVLDPGSGEVVEERFSADRESLWTLSRAMSGPVEAVAIEATTGWSCVWRELAVRGFDVRFAEPVQARACSDERRSARTDRLDARWLARLSAKEMLPESWIPPAQIQGLRDRTRLRKALADDRRRWGQRLHAFLAHEAWPCSRSRLHLLAEIGEARRFRRGGQITRLAGLDPVVDEPGETRRRGKLAKAGSAHLGWAVVEAAVHAHRTTAPYLVPLLGRSGSGATRPWPGSQSLARSAGLSTTCCVRSPASPDIRAAGESALVRRGRRSEMPEVSEAVSAEVPA